MNISRLFALLTLPALIASGCSDGGGSASDDAGPDTVWMDASADTGAADTAPADTAPADTAPADTAPADTAPADTAPADTAPADTVPADTAPADTAPADTVPADTVPADTVPADTLSTDTMPWLGDSCADPRALVFSQGGAGGTATDQGDLAALSHSAISANCGSYGPDRVYSFTTTETLNLRVDVSATGFPPVLYLRSSCAGQELICATGAGSTCSLDQPTLAPGTHFLILDSPSGASGTFNLSAELTPPAQGDRCVDPIPLAFSGNQASAQGDLKQLFDNHSSVYCGGSGPEVVYSFTTTTTRALSVSVTTAASTSPVLYLRSSCTGTEIVCTEGTAGTGSLQRPSLAAGTYYLFLDSPSGLTDGTFNLTATLAQP